MEHRAPEAGYIAKFRVGDITTFIHWSFPVGGLLVVAILDEWTTVSVLASISAYTILVLLHELGHAYFARRAKSQIYALVITGGGGFCYASAPPRAIDKFFFYAGGLIAQAILFIAAIAYIAVFGSPQSSVLNCYLFTFIIFNAILFVGNVIPWRANDGSMLVHTIRELRSEA